MKEINIRRSVRLFNDKKIKKDDILKILRAGMQAPSAGNQQAWEFIVVDKEERIKEIQRVSKYGAPLGRANVCVIVLGNKSRARFPENLEQELGAVCQNMLLEATHLQIGSLWTSVSPLEDRMSFVKQFANLNDEVYPYAILAFGYPKDQNAFVYKDNFDESKIHWD